MISEDNFAATFSSGGITLRVSTVPGFVPYEHTIVGFEVRDLVTTVKGLRERDVKFNRYPQFKQDDLGVLKIPGTETHVAWFTDPDGNVLSVTTAR